jgi:Flp pilus assembly secretin CpaC
MNMLDAFGNVKRPRRKSSGSGMFVLGAVAVLCLGAAIPIYGADPRQEGTALADFQTNGGSRKGNTLTMVEGTLARLKFARPISTDDVGAKIADRSIAEMQAASTTELVVTALKVGRTNLLVRFKDGEPEVFDIVVHRDLSVLGEALKGIHPTIEVQAASDRNALILTGTVPDSNASSRAQQAALDFAQAIGTEGKVINLIRVQAAATSIEASLTSQMTRIGAPDVVIARIQKGPIANDAEDVFIISGSVPNLVVADNVTDMVRATVGDDAGKKSRVVSQITVGGRPSAIENMLERAIQEQLGQTGVKVSRVVGTDSEGDNDILILTGTVANQTALIRVLTLSAKVFQQQSLVKRKRDGEYTRITETYAGGLTRTTDTPLKLSDVSDDIRVAADESGALFTDDFGERSDTTGTNSALRSVLGTRNGGFSGSGSTGLGGLVENRLDSNLARAKAIELAEGRILSFIQVTDIPQIRVSVRFFELSRNDLLKWDSQVNKLGVADFDTNGINPNTPLFGANDTIVQNANGDPILFASNTDIANVISFLEGGFSDQILIGGEHFNLDAVLNVLETEGVARTLASPTLTVLSGEIAAFGDGGSVSVTSSISTPVGVNDADLGVFQSVQQLPFGIQLAVRPLIDEDGYITLDVAPSVSNPDFALTALVRTTTGTPQETVAFSERNLRTSARLRDGEVLLIGGLQDRSRKDEAGKTPFLSNIPIIGWLFQDKKFEDKDREVMITVNPTIVRDRLSQAMLWSFPGTRELLRREPPPQPPAEQTPPPSPEGQPVPASGTKAPAGK